MDERVTRTTLLATLMLLRGKKNKRKRKKMRRNSLEKGSHWPITREHLVTVDDETRQDKSHYHHSTACLILTRKTLTILWIIFQTQPRNKWCCSDRSIDTSKMSSPRTHRKSHQANIDNQGTQTTPARSSDKK